MNQPFFYCSQLSLGAGEEAFGTASIGEVWLLLEYRPAWGWNALLDSELAPIVKRRLVRALKSIPKSKLLLIKQERYSRDPLAFYVVRCREQSPFIVRYQLDSYHDLLSMNIGAAAAGKPIGGDVVSGPLHLVCTHGRRDKCCAKFGFALYKSLRAIAGDAVWQTSHIGGDRFAANLVSFPHGVFHARVGEEEGRNILDHYVAGRVVLENYRGRACYGRFAQAGEYFIRQASGNLDLDGLRFEGQSHVGDHVWNVAFLNRESGLHHQARIAARTSNFQTFVTCHSTEEQTVAQYFLEEYSVSTL